LRGVDARSATLDEPLDIAVIGVPATTPHLPRERPNPVLAAYLALAWLAMARSLWWRAERGLFALIGGSASVADAVPGVLQLLRTPHPRRSRACVLGRCPACRRADPRTPGVCESRSCHPLPFADWAACLPWSTSWFWCSSRGASMPAARQFGFVPTGRPDAAIAARACRRRAGRASWRYPYFPIRVTRWSTPG
jgi:hypothetical protein